MGCASSKRIEATVDVYRPPPSSFAVFDINAIEEPWLKTGEEVEDREDIEKPRHVPPPILQKLKAIDEAPGTWDEVSKALEDVKSTLNNPQPPPPSSAIKPLDKLTSSKEAPSVKAPRKNSSFHTLEELEAKVSSKENKEATLQRKQEKPDDVELKKLQFQPNIKNESESEPASGGGVVSEGVKSVKDNMFIVKDRLEREKEGKTSTFVKRDLLSDFEDKCPPGGSELLVLYTTSLGGVRRTFEDCNRVRTILETHRVVFDERDISLHGQFLNELKQLLGDGVSVPKLFVKGKYIGGVEQVVGLNETGRLGRILNWTRVERGVGRLACEGCGGARFLPCFDCGGSCKLVVGGEKQRCPKCNENGLVHCPLCI